MFEHDRNLSKKIAVATDKPIAEESYIARIYLTRSLPGKSVFYHMEFDGDPDRIRTCDPQIRNLMLYPAELRGPGKR